MLRRMARSQDGIGWVKFMEGMISKEVVAIQEGHHPTSPSLFTLEAWAIGLVTRLLEITHGQWIYCNALVHDGTTGALAMVVKEDLQRAIEDKVEKGVEGLDEQDRWLLEINLGNLEDASGEDHYYWLLAIQAARVSRELRLKAGGRVSQQSVSRGSRA